MQRLVDRFVRDLFELIRATVVDAIPVKQHRGRPRGSKNKVAHTKPKAKKQPSKKLVLKKPVPPRQRIVKQIVNVPPAKPTKK